MGPRRFEHFCAPCIPGNTCPCGWAPSMEECDGADLGGQSCEKLGFVGGELRCKADCTFDKSDCLISARVKGQVTTSSATGLLIGRDFALARNGDVLAVASSETGVVRFRTADATNLRGRTPESKWAPPPNYPQGAVGLDRLNRSWLDPLWSPVLAPAGDGFVLAVEHAAGSGSRIQTFRPSGRQVALGTPIASFPGGRPRFLVPGQDVALLGFVRRGLEVVRVDATGALVGEPVVLPVLVRQLGHQAAAAWTGDGWTIAASSEHWNERDARLSVVRVTRDGTVGPHQDLDTRGTVGAVIASPDGATVYYADEEGLGAIDVPNSGPPRSPVRIAVSQLGAPLAVERNGEAVVIWAWGRSGVTRVVTRPLQPPEVTPMFAVPGKEPRAAVSYLGVFHVVFAAEMGDLAPVVSVAR